MACAAFLDLNGVVPTFATNDAVYELVMGVASTPIEIDKLARSLRTSIDLDR